jgi:nucleotide-binding universal stress UspA family protein
MALKDLIVHLDQAESARERLRLAANLAHRHGCRLTAIYVREPNEAQSCLRRTAEPARASGKNSTVSVSMFGSPLTERISLSLCS